MQEVGSYLRLSQGYMEELDRHRGREGKVECDAECESVHMLWASGAKV